MFGLIKQAFIGFLCFSRFLPSIVNIPSHSKCISSNKQQCMTQPLLINLHPNEYIERLRYYLFTVIFDRCMKKCNTLNDLSLRFIIIVPNKTEDLNFSVPNMIIGMSKILIKYTSCKCKYQFATLP